MLTENFRNELDELARKSLGKMTPEEKLEAFQRIVDNKQADYIEGVLVDAFSAQAVLHVYNNIGEENQGTYLAYPVVKMVDMAWKLTSPKNESIEEDAPEGWEGTVKAMKKEPGIDNPWALAWWMKKKGYKPHKKESVGEDQEYMMEDGELPATVVEIRKDPYASGALYVDTPRGQKRISLHDVDAKVREKVEVGQKGTYKIVPDPYISYSTFVPEELEEAGDPRSRAFSRMMKPIKDKRVWDEYHGKRAEERRQHAINAIVSNFRNGALAWPQAVEQLKGKNVSKEDAEKMLERSVGIEDELAPEMYKDEPFESLEEGVDTPLNSNEVIRALENAEIYDDEDSDEQGFLDLLSSRIEQSFPDNVTYSQILEITKEPAFNQFDVASYGILDYVFRISGLDNIVYEEELNEDWGSSDWSILIKQMDEDIERMGGLNPENIEAAVAVAAEMHGEHIGFDMHTREGEEQAQAVILSMYIHRKGLDKFFSAPSDVEEAVDPHGGMMISPYENELTDEERDEEWEFMQDEIATEIAVDEENYTDPEDREQDAVVERVADKVYTSMMNRYDYADWDEIAREIRKHLGLDESDLEETDRLQKLAGIRK